MVDTFIALSQRNEVFWIGLALFLLGVFIPQAWGIGLSRTLVVLGGGILFIRIFVGSFRILKTTAKAGGIGYREGKS